MRLLKYLFFNAAFMAVGYFALWLGNSNAMALFKFWFWLSFSLQFLGAFAKPETLSDLSKHGRAVPAGFDAGLSIFTAFAFAWFGHPVMAVFTILGFGFEMSMWESIEKAKKSAPPKV